MLELLQQALLDAFTPSVLATIVAGTIIGIIFGTIPGLSATMAVALALPLTFAMDTTHAMALLMGLYLGGISGGLVASTLINIPGTPSSIASTFDGYPMTQNGQAGKALSFGIISSFFGGLLSFIVLLFMAPVVASFAVRLGPHEYFSLALFAITMVAVLAGGNLAKGILAAALGVLLAMVGTAPVDGTVRFTYGSIDLLSGFDILPVLIGLFAVAEVLKGAQEGALKVESKKIRIRGLDVTVGELLREKWNWLRSSVIGLGIGILPGMGGGTSNLVSYGAAKSASKTPEKFGKGTPSGVVASESSNNASVGGALLPVLTLGIPGDTVTAMLIGALTIQGISPGPLLITNQPDVLYGIYAALIVANVVMLVVMLVGRKGFLYVLRIPKYILLPSIMVLCVVGAYANNNRLFDVVTIFVFGALGYAFSKLGIPLPALLLGFILGPIIERNFSEALMLGAGSYVEFVARPVSGLFLVATVIIVAIIGVRNRRDKAKSEIGAG